VCGNSEGHQQAEDGLPQASRCDINDILGREWESFACGEFWSEFPTVSPVHAGNDGIPFDVARLTIPFSRWRTEALKACGNAIVPQVFYELLRAIEIVEEQQ
jgi:DNA (cytosine-5)-methyltransferase 1